MWELLVEIVRAVIKESECVALFTICVALLFTLHTFNRHRLQEIKRELEDHKQHCPDMRQRNAPPRE